MEILLNILIILAGWAVLTPVLIVGFSIIICYGSFQEIASKTVVYGFWISVLTVILGIYVVFPVFVFV